MREQAGLRTGRAYVVCSFCQRIIEIRRPQGTADDKAALIDALSVAVPLHVFHGCRSGDEPTRVLALSVEDPWP